MQYLDVLGKLCLSPTLKGWTKNINMVHFAQLWWWKILACALLHARDVHCCMGAMDLNFTALDNRLWVECIWMSWVPESRVGGLRPHEASSEARGQHFWPHFSPQASLNLSAGLGLGLTWGLLRPHKVLTRTHKDICEDFCLTSKIQYDNWKLHTHTVILMKHHYEASLPGIGSPSWFSPSWNNHQSPPEEFWEAYGASWRGLTMKTVQKALKCW